MVSGMSLIIKRGNETRVVGLVQVGWLQCNKVTQIDPLVCNQLSCLSKPWLQLHAERQLQLSRLLLATNSIFFNGVANYCKV